MHDANPSGIAGERREPPTQSSLLKQLVVNADDFGMSRGINKGIFEAHCRGILTSATLLANGKAFEQAVESSKFAPTLGIGVHLNLTQGAPICDPATVPSLVNKDGKFFSHPAALLRRHLAGRLQSVDVERELAAQIEKVRAAGIAITHLDGHKHVQVFPGILPMVIRLAKHFGITGVRCSAERIPRIWPLLRENKKAALKVMKQYLRAHALARIAVNSRMQIRAANLNTPGDFYGVAQTGFLDFRQLALVLRTLRSGTSELMCHPGYVEEAKESNMTRLRTERERELDALTRPETVQLVAGLGIDLINYKGL